MCSRTLTPTLSSVLIKPCGSPTAERAIASNNAQVVTLGSLITGPEVAKKLVDIWLANEFQGGGSAQKVEKINKLEN